MSCELILVRHAQASFGADDYDVLSELGHRQGAALGAALAARGERIDAVFVGAQRRHRETLEAMAPALALDVSAAQVLPGLNEFSSGDLLDARFGNGPRPPGLGSDREAHFRILRDTVLAWQREEIGGRESFVQFTERVLRARRLMGATGRRVLAVTSGGAICRMIADVLEAPPAQMMHLQLQLANCAVSRIMIGQGGMRLHSFNEMPHVSGPGAEFVTYS
ncbi:histidine phosphatase family protein [Profundibacterium mesophilum]|uniref:Phosphoglycerate mutase n=1 Tax=Profundibacterium mesophilum KAUST100406-0324 TaxID=1037889 RepID=A0A921NT33_9RHOB|nr:histidine phosphatase family protein [Profundibacterium mesophilum]KAF0674606.1 phosphoglycerate mutase [Profundibacterium mesophilum KAUST100406-0324]